MTTDREYNFPRLTADAVKTTRDDFNRRFDAQPSGSGFVKLNATGHPCIFHGLERVKLIKQGGGTTTVLGKNVSARILKAVAKGKHPKLGTVTVSFLQEENKRIHRVILCAFPGDFVSVTPVVENLRYGTIEVMKFDT